MEFIDLVPRVLADTKKKEAQFHLLLHELIPPVAPWHQDYKVRTVEVLHTKTKTRD